MFVAFFFPKLYIEPVSLFSVTSYHLCCLYTTDLYSYCYYATHQKAVVRD